MGVGIWLRRGAERLGAGKREREKAMDKTLTLVSIVCEQFKRASDFVGPRASRPRAYGGSNYQKLTLTYAGGRDARGPKRALAWFNLAADFFDFPRYPFPLFPLNSVKSDPKLIINRSKVRSSV